MKIPRKVKILNRHYSVVRNNNLSDSYAGERCWGVIDFDKAIIVMRKRDTEEFQEFKEAETFMHEILHGLDEAFEIGLSEKKISTLAVGIVTAIRDNKLDFLDYE